jgi:flagellar hook assembly protein FlgD
LIVKDRLNFALSLDAATRVNARIVDITGRVVQSVIDRQLSSGDHQFSIAHNLANGIYFFFVDTDNSHQIEKLVVVR